MRLWVGYGPSAWPSCREVSGSAQADGKHARARSGAALASETGYFDQAHLTLDLTSNGRCDTTPSGVALTRPVLQDPLRRRLSKIRPLD